MDDRNLLYAVLAICAVSLVANLFVMLEIDKERTGVTDAPANVVGMSGCTNLCVKLGEKGCPMGVCLDICQKEAVIWHGECMRRTQNNPVKCDTYNQIIMMG